MVALVRSLADGAAAVDALGRTARRSRPLGDSAMTSEDALTFDPEGVAWIVGPLVEPWTIGPLLEIIP